MSDWFWLPVTDSNCLERNSSARQWIRFLINSYLSTNLRDQGPCRTATQKRDSSSTVMCTASSTKTRDRPASALCYQNRLRNRIAQTLSLRLRLRGQQIVQKSPVAQPQQSLFQGRNIQEKPYQIFRRTQTLSLALRRLLTWLTRMRLIPFIVHLRFSMQKTSACYTIPSLASLRQPSTPNPYQKRLHRQRSGIAKRSSKDFDAVSLTN